MMTKEQFESLSPRQRGAVVYLLGARKDEPNVPDEKNPYPEKTWDWYEWESGATQAVMIAQDSEE